MHADVRDLLTSLRTAEHVGPQWSVVDDWVVGRELGRLRELASALAERPAAEWQARSVLEHIVKRLALTPDSDFAAVVRDLARVHDPRYLASLVASGQRPEVAASLVEGGEFGPCLAQELVLRSSGVEQRRWRGHPLTWLPLRLTEIEDGVELPHYTERGSSFATPYRLLEDAPAGDATLTARVARDITSPVDELATTAFADWLTHSNGKVEVRVFELEAADENRAPLAGAGLDCLAGAQTVRVWDASARYAFEIAFAAASTGGAYSRGRHGAYGRLDAWRTIAGLVGAGPAAHFEEVHAAATASRWFGFASDARWFHRVAWDVGLAVQREDGGSLAVLAATDED